VFEARTVRLGVSTSEDGGSMDPEFRSAIVDAGQLPAARAEDVSSPEAAVLALYEAISGPSESERERDWDRVRSLFLRGARLVLVRWQSPSGGNAQVLRAWDVEGFIETSRFFYKDSSFYERELCSRTARFGNIAHVFSTYASYLGPDDDAPVMRGINSVQLVSDGSRWWIANLVWDLEQPGNPIPADLLTASDRRR
jgi:hypothetical protein